MTHERVYIAYVRNMTGQKFDSTSHLNWIFRQFIQPSSQCSTCCFLYERVLMLVEAWRAGIQWIIVTTLWARKTDLWMHLFAKCKFESLQMCQITWGMQQHRSHNHCLLLKAWWQIKWHNLGQIISKRAPQCFTTSIKHSHTRADLSGCGRIYFTGCFFCLLFVFVLFCVSVSFLLSVIGDMTTGRRERSSDRMAPAASLLQKADRMKRWLVSLKSLKMVRRSVQVNIRLQLSILSGLVWNVSTCKERGHLH